MRRIEGAVLILGLLGLCGLVNAAEPTSKLLELDIRPRPVGDALNEFARQSGLQVAIDPKDGAGITTRRLAGTFTPDAALTKLLSSTGLTYEYINPRTVAVRQGVRGAPERAGKQPAQAATRPIDVRSAEEPNQRQTDRQNSQDRQNASEERRSVAQLEEVIVTGTHIRGVRSSASPVEIYDRNQIDMTGLGNVQEFVQRLPQNFKGGASEGTVGAIAGGGRARNTVGGTGVNLRGLGNDSTLVLINGRRVPSGGNSGTFVDVSLIPLAAVERIEVVPDGASAIYGSDAVGGVINFILRRDFEGAETRARYGLVTEGDSRELQAGQTFGHDWGSGSALLSYEYFDRTILDASDKSHTRALVGPFTLLPKQKRHGAFATIGQNITPGLDLFADGTYAQRSTLQHFTFFPFFSQQMSADVETYSATVGGRAKLSDLLEFELSSAYAVSDTSFNAINNRTTRVADRQTDTSILSLDAKVDGPLWTAPAGPVLFAIGGQYREEEFDQDDLLTRRRFQPRRDVLAGFAEIQVPLVGPSSTAPSAKPSANRLELTLAARSERYSDFGSTNNPKFGAVWRPTSSLAFRGTYGTSFKAPLLSDLDPVPFQVAANSLFDPLIGGNTNVLIVFGGNPDLGPEEATTWTFGLDLLPESLPGLRTNVTYYNIRFKDRIVDAQTSGLPIFDALRFEDVVGPIILQRNPSQSRVQELVASTATFDDFTGIPGGVDLATIGAIVDARAHNISEVNTSGIDFGLSYTTDVALGKLEAGIDGTYILEFDTQATPTAPVFEILNTVYNPVDLKLRARGVVQRGGLSVAAFFNYTDSYQDVRRGGSVPVDSWTTADVSVGYEFGPDRGLLSAVSTVLSVINITDEDPPFVASPSPAFLGALNFDGANANLLGRFVSLQIAKRW